MRRRGKRVLLWLLPLVFGALLAVVPRLVDTAEVPRSLEEYTAALKERVPTPLDRYGVPGASIALVVDGEVVWSEGFGLRDRQTGEPVTSDTVFQAGSISKSLVAWAVLRLAEEGLVKLDRPVGEQIDGWSLPDADYPTDEVSPLRLLAHTGGLPFAVPGLPVSTDELRHWEVDASLFEVQ